MSRYATGKVYRIESQQTEQVYVGSTVLTIAQRLAVHRSMHRAHSAGKAPYYSAFELLKYDDACVVLIEDCACETKQELHACERKWIETTPNCVNRQIPGRTDKEYRAANRATAAAYARQYQAANKDKLAEQHHQYYLANKDTHAAKGKQWRETNRNAIKAQATQIIICECGAETTYGHASRHRQTKKHMRIIGELAVDPIAGVEPVAD